MESYPAEDWHNPRWRQFPSDPRRREWGTQMYHTVFLPIKSNDYDAANAALRDMRTALVRACGVILPEPSAITEKNASRIAEGTWRLIDQLFTSSNNQGLQMRWSLAFDELA